MTIQPMVTTRRNKRLLLLMILMLALSLRVGAAFFLGDSLETPQQRRIQDQVSYNALAESLIDGQGFSFRTHWYPFTLPNHPTAHWSFLYPLYLAGVYAVTGFHPLAARLIQILVTGTLSIWLYYRLGRRLFGEAAGLAAAGLGAVYAYFVFYDVALMTESLYIVGVLAMLDLSLDIAAGKERWILLGVVLGLTALLRQTALLWLPFLLAWIVWARSKRQPLGWQLGKGAAQCLAIVALLILPWTVRNWIVYQTFLPLNSNAGFALYSANHPNQGTTFEQDYVAPLPLKELSAQGWQSFPNEAQWNSILTGYGLRFVLEDPVRYLQLSLSRVPIFFNFWFTDQAGRMGDLLRLFSYGLYLPLFAWGLARSWRWRRDASLIYLFTLVYSLMHILTWASVRYRLPVDAALVPFSGLAVVEIITLILTKVKWPVADALRRALISPRNRQST